MSTRFSRGQLDCLHRSGFDVAIATRISEPARLDVDAVVTTFDLPFARQPAPLSDLRALVATVRLMRRLRPSIVHAATPKAGLLGMIAARLTRVPVRVYALHGLRYETATGVARRVLVLFERIAVRCSTHVIADSKSIVAQARVDGLFGSTKCYVVGAGSSNGVDTQRFAPADRRTARAEFGIDGDRTVIGFVGRLTNDKGIGTLLDVHDHLAQRGTPATLLVVGDFEPGDPVADEVSARIGHADRIVHVPWTDTPERAYSAIDVLVFPSLREGLPNAPLEAQSCGTPVVGYRATGTVDAVTVGGQLVDVGDVTGLSAAVATLLDDDEQRLRAGAAGRAFVVEHFDQQVLWKRRAELFHEWLGDDVGR